MSDDASRSRVHPLVRLMSLNEKNRFLTRYFLSELHRTPTRTKPSPAEIHPETPIHKGAHT